MITHCFSVNKKGVLSLTKINVFSLKDNTLIDIISSIALKLVYCLSMNNTLILI
jgi:hypothetical protein